MVVNGHDFDVVNEKKLATFFADSGNSGLLSKSEHLEFHHPAKRRKMEPHLSANAPQPKKTEK